MLLSRFSSMLLTPCISWMGSGYVISVNSSSQITSWDSSAQILLKNGLNVTFVSRTGFSVLPKLSLNGFLAPSQSLSDSLLYMGLFMTAGIYTEMLLTLLHVHTLSKPSQACSFSCRYIIFTLIFDPCVPSRNLVANCSFSALTNASKWKHTLGRKGKLLISSTKAKLGTC